VTDIIIKYFASTSIEDMARTRDCKTNGRTTS